MNWIFSISILRTFPNLKIEDDKTPSYTNYFIIIIQPYKLIIALSFKILYLSIKDKVLNFLRYYNNSSLFYLIFTFSIKTLLLFMLIKENYILIKRFVRE